MEAELATVRGQIDEAATTGALFEKPLRDLQRKEIELLTDIKAARLVGDFQQREQARTNQTLQAQRQQVLDQAVSLYPSMKDRTSAQFRIARSIAMDAAAAAPGTQEYEDSHAADAPLRFARQAAEQLGIKPSGAAAPAPSSVPQTPPTPKPVSPAPGSKSAAPPPPALTRDQIIAKSTQETLDATEGRVASNIPRGRGTIFVR
jgi:hypothetical protein